MFGRIDGKRAVRNDAYGFFCCFQPINMKKKGK